MQEFREGRGELLAEHPRVLLWIPFKCISPVNQFFNRSSFRRDRREFSWRRELQNLDSKLPIMVGGSFDNVWWIKFSAKVAINLPVNVRNLFRISGSRRAPPRNPLSRPFHSNRWRDFTLHLETSLPPSSTFPPIQIPNAIIKRFHHRFTTTGSNDVAKINPISRLKIHEYILRIRHPTNFPDLLLSIESLSSSSFLKPSKERAGSLLLPRKSRFILDSPLLPQRPNSKAGEERKEEEDNILREVRSSNTSASKRGLPDILEDASP